MLRESGGNIGPGTLGIATEICVAASNNDVALLESWNLAGISLNLRNATGRTPLHEAVCALCRESVEYLLSRDVSSRHIFIDFFVGGCVNQVEITRDLYYARVCFGRGLGRGRAVRTGGFL